MSPPRPLAHSVGTIAVKALGRRGLAFGPLLADWASIMGQDLAAHAVPAKLAFPPGRRDEAVLHLRVTPAAALEIQHAAPQILERINACLGHRAVARLKLIQAPAAVSARPRRRSLSAAEDAAIAAATADVTDGELRAALERLGRSLKATAPR